MPKRRTSWFSLVLVLAMLLSTSVAASAQGNENDNGNDVHLPFVSNDALEPIGPLAPPPDLSTLRQTPAAMPPSDVTIVIMAQAPAVAYAGGVAGFAATQPAEGEKLNAASADVVSYAQFLQSSQASVLAAAGAGPQPGRLPLHLCAQWLCRTPDAGAGARRGAAARRAHGAARRVPL